MTHLAGITRDHTFSLFFFLQVTKNMPLRPSPTRAANRDNRHRQASHTCGTHAKAPPAGPQSLRAREVSTSDRKPAEDTFARMSLPSETCRYRPPLSVALVGPQALKINYSCSETHARVLPIPDINLCIRRQLPWPKIQTAPKS